jgi:hypothetical protein
MARIYLKGATIVLICLVLAVGQNHLNNVIVIVTLGTLVTILLSCGFILSKQPQNKQSITFKVWLKSKSFI